MDGQRPSELLRRYRVNVYPPSLSPEDRLAVINYLAEKRGLQPGAGAAGIGREKTSFLVHEAMKDMSLLAPEVVRNAVVGPSTAGVENAISLYVPANHRPHENLGT